MDIHQIHQLFKDRISLLVFFDILFLALPGVLVLFLLYPSIFLSLDWIRLILLSTSFVLPFAFVNTIFILSSWESTSSKEDDLFFAFSLGSIFAGLAFFMALAVWKIPSHYAHNLPLNVVILEVMIILVSWYDGKYGSKRILRTPWGTRDNPRVQSQVEAGTLVAPDEI